MELTLHDFEYNEDMIDVYDLDDTLVFYTSEKIGSSTVNTQIRLDKKAQMELYKALDKHLFGDYESKVMESLEPYEKTGDRNVMEPLEPYEKTDDSKVMIDARKLMDKINHDIRAGITAQEVVCYLNGYIEGKKND